MLANDDIARIFQEIAEIMELRGDDVFRVRAYLNAARVIDGLAEPLAEIRARGELRKIKGIGEKITAKIEEMLDTGRLRKHDELAAEFPAGVRAMMAVPGVGPRKAGMLYRELGITSIDELERAAKEGLIRALRGFGEKSEAEILEGIARLHRRTGRIPLARAYPLAGEIIACLRAAALIHDIEPAGSLRRMREDIGDIDILVTSDDPAAVMAAVARLPMAREVLLTGPTKTSIVTVYGLQVDVRVVEPENFGAALQYFTGSKEHNVKLRTLASRMGFKLSEYGIFRDSGERLGGRTEEEMYRPLGIAMFPPELREDRGEIELGLRGIVPEFIQAADIRGDLHVHTDWSDGRATLEEMARAARERGYAYLGIADHSSGRGGGLTIERLREQMRQIRALNETLDGITLLRAAEVDIRRDGTLDFPDDVLAELDLCIASVHSSFNLPEGEQTARVLKALDNPFVDLLGHPTGRLIGEREPLNLNIRRIMEAEAERGVAMEINSWPERLDLNDDHILLARELGVPLMINTDSHAAHHLAQIRFGAATARRGWAEPKDVLNTLPLEQFLSRLRRNRQISEC